MVNPVPEDWLTAIVDSSEDSIVVVDRQRIIRFLNKPALALADQTGVRLAVGERLDMALRNHAILDEDGHPVPPEMCPIAVTLEEGKEVRGKRFQLSIRDRLAWVKLSSFPIRDAAGTVEFAILRLSDISDVKFQEDKLTFLIKASKVYPITVDVEERLTQKARLTVPLIADWCMALVVAEDGSTHLASVVHRDPEKMTLLNDLVQHVGSGHPDRGIRKVIKTGIAEFYPDVNEDFLGKIFRNREELSVALKLGLTSAMILPISSRGVVLGALALGYADSKRTYSHDDFVFMQEYCSHISTLFENAHLYGELKRRDASKDAFLATLSHELRNPLAPIKSMLELMKMQVHDTELRRNISVIEHQFDHLTKVLTDLLEMNRYLQGKIHVELRRVNLLTVMRNSIDSAKPFFKKKNIDLEVALPERPVVIRADQTRLEQALMNVLHNAEKFTPAGGRITMNVTVGDTTVSISIRDTGIGIEPSRLEHLFEPGAHDEKSMHKTEGLGLGLVLVKDILQLHNGSIEAKSEGVGKGSEFIITLPILERPLL